MTTKNVVYPEATVKFITEKTTYIETYDTSKVSEDIKNGIFEESVVQISTVNEMSDDTPIFTIMLVGYTHWDLVLKSNDLVKISVNPDTKVDRGISNPNIMTGMISEVFKMGEYEDGMQMYRVTGRSMAKALMDFEVGTVKEVSTAPLSLGWLPDGDGINFTGNSAWEVAEEIMERFIYKYSEYSFSDGKELRDYLYHDFDSWSEYETLGDATPYTNYEGSIRQFLEDLTAKPFNEFYFDFTETEECVAIMRRTPFDHDEWQKLHHYEITSDLVLSEDFGRSDVEAHSIFIVQSPQIIALTGMDIGVYPRYHPDLIKKYGYKRLEVENRYLLLGSDSIFSEPDIYDEDGEPDQDKIEELAENEGEAVQPAQPPSFKSVVSFYKDANITSEDARLNPEDAIAVTLDKFPTMPEDVAIKILAKWVDGTFTDDVYKDIIEEHGGGHFESAEETAERDASHVKLDLFTQKMFNWYADNPSFYAGDITVVGNPMYRVGSKLYYRDKERDTVWEFYIEAVSHDFSYDNGYLTTLGVTRGLPHNGDARFTNFFGKSEEFAGGYFGEMSLADQREQRKREEMANSGGTPGTSPTGGTLPNSQGGTVATRVIKRAQQLTSVKSVYTWGGGRSTKNPLQVSGTIKVDCSSFVWWLYQEQGVEFPHSSTSMNTDTIKLDKRLETVTKRGTTKMGAKAFLKLGDIVYFDTYKSDGHLGIYIGNDKFIGCQGDTGIAVADMTSSFWNKSFNGHILRYNG